MSLSFATHLPSSSDQSFTDSHISSGFVFLPSYSAVLSVSDCFILSPSFSFLMFLLLATITFCLRSLVCCFSRLLLSLYLSLVLMCQPTPVIHTRDGRPHGHRALRDPQLRQGERPARPTAPPPCLPDCPVCLSICRLACFLPRVPPPAEPTLLHQTWEVFFFIFYFELIFLTLMTFG